MEPLNDRELNPLLRKWEAPSAPASLQSPAGFPRRSAWKWLLSGRIHVPVPVGLALILAAAGMIYSSRTVPSPNSPAAGNTVSPVVTPAPLPVPPETLTTPQHRSAPAPDETSAPATAALSGFQPVRQLELKILREQP